MPLPFSSPSSLLPSPLRRSLKRSHCWPLARSTNPVPALSPMFQDSPTLSKTVCPPTRSADSVPPSPTPAATHFLLCPIVDLTPLNSTTTSTAPSATSTASTPSL